jgi:YVTN family beta-propeller protein
MMKRTVFTITVAALMLGGFSFMAQSNYKLVRKIHVGGDGGWDYLTVDEANGRIFVSHSTVVQVIDIKTGLLAGTIPGTKGIHGIAIANDLNKGFTSNGQDSSSTVFDLQTLEVITKIKVTGQNPDAILYDTFSKRVFTGNGRSASFSVIDAVNNKEIGVIPLAGKPEAIVTDGKGKIYVNIEDQNLIQVIDASKLTVLGSWPIDPGEEPSGLALDNQTHLLFGMCSNQLMVVVDAESGKGTMTVVQEGNNHTFNVIETVN